MKQATPSNIEDISQNNRINDGELKVAREIFANATIHRDMARYAGLNMLSYLLDLVVRESGEMIGRGD